MIKERHHKKFISCNFILKYPKLLIFTAINTRTRWFFPHKVRLLQICSTKFHLFAWLWSLLKNVLTNDERKCQWRIKVCFTSIITGVRCNFKFGDVIVSCWATVKIFKNCRFGSVEATIRIKTFKKYGPLFWFPVSTSRPHKGNNTSPSMWKS